MNKRSERIQLHVAASGTAGLVFLLFLTSQLSGGSNAGRLFPEPLLILGLLGVPVCGLYFLISLVALFVSRNNPDDPPLGKVDRRVQINASELQQFLKRTPLEIGSTDDHRYVLANGTLIKIPKHAGTSAVALQPRQTQIVQVLLLEHGLIVREDYVKFAGSNLYLVDHDLGEVWTAELPSSTDIYANTVTQTADGLSCSTWEGWTCLVSPQTGTILSCTFVK